MDETKRVIYIIVLTTSRGAEWLGTSFTASSRFSIVAAIRSIICSASNPLEHRVKPAEAWQARLCRLTSFAISL